MAQELKKGISTRITIGPFVDVGNGFTPETGITIDAADEAEIVKHNATGVTAISGTLTAIASMDGWYYMTMASTDVNTVGMLTVAIQDDSACLPVHKEFMVVTAEYYDTKYNSTTSINVNVVQISGDSAAADNLESAFDGTGYAGGTTLQKVNVDSIRTDTQSAIDLKDFADAGYDPGTNKVQGLVLADTVTDVSNQVASSLTSVTYTTATSFHASVTGYSTFDPAATGVSLGAATYTTATAFHASVTGYSTFDPAATGVTLGSAVYTGISDFKATGFSTFNPASDGVSLGSAVYTAISDFRATGFSTFNAASDGVSLGSATYTTATAFHASVTGYSTFDATSDTVLASLTAAGADAIHDEVIEGTTTNRQAQRLFLSVLTGKVSGGSTTTITFRDIGDTKNRLVTTVDVNGNRTAVGTRDGS